MAMARGIIQNDNQKTARALGNKKPSKQGMRKLLEGMSQADAQLRETARQESQYRKDVKHLVERTVGYLAHLGIAKSKSELDSLLLRNVLTTSKANDDDVKRGLEELSAKKSELD